MIAFQRHDLPVSNRSCPLCCLHLTTKGIKVILLFVVHNIMRVTYFDQTVLEVSGSSVRQVMLNATIARLGGTWRRRRLLACGYRMSFAEAKDLYRELHESNDPLLYVNAINHMDLLSGGIEKDGKICTLDVVCFFYLVPSMGLFQYGRMLSPREAVSNCPSQLAALYREEVVDFEDNMQAFKSFDFKYAMVYDDEVSQNHARWRLETKFVIWLLNRTDQRSIRDRLYTVGEIRPEFIDMNVLMNCNYHLGSILYVLLSNIVLYFNGGMPERNAKSACEAVAMILSHGVRIDNVSSVLRHFTRGRMRNIVLSKGNYRETFLGVERHTLAGLMVEVLGLGTIYREHVFSAIKYAVEDWCLTDWRPADWWHNCPYSPPAILNMLLSSVSAPLGLTEEFEEYSATNMYSRMIGIYSRAVVPAVAVAALPNALDFLPLAGRRGLLEITDYEMQNKCMDGVSLEVQRVLKRLWRSGSVRGLKGYMSCKMREACMSVFYVARANQRLPMLPLELWEKIVALLRRDAWEFDDPAKPLGASFKWIGTSEMLGKEVA